MKQVKICWVCITEWKEIVGIFENKKDAEFFADIFNKDPEFDDIVRVYEWGIAPKIKNKQNFARLAKIMIVFNKNKKKD